MRRPLLIGSVAPSGAERVAMRLKELGVDFVFSIPGSQVLPIWDALDRVNGPRLIVPRTERAAALMAEGYGLASGRPAVVMNTLGPGVANEAVAVASAKLSSAPVVYLTPCQPPAKRTRIDEVFQGLDHGAFLSGAAKQQLLCDSTDQLEPMIDEAFASAIADSAGPVRLDVSFPILFRRARRRGGRQAASHQTRPPKAAPGADLVLALDDSSLTGSATLATAGLFGDLERSVMPGADGPGMGAPFALGLRLGRPRTPVVLALTAESLLAQLDTVIVATAEGVPVTIAAAADSPEAALAKPAALATGAAWWPIDSGDSPEAVRANFHQRTRGLTILVVDQPAD